MAAPRPPPWTHDNTSHSSLLAGFEIGLPPGRQAPGPILSAAEARVSYINKELPPIPSPLPSPTSTLPSISATPPAIPARNPRRFSWVSSAISSDTPTSYPPRRSISSTSPSSPPLLALKPQRPTTPSFPSPPKAQPRLTLKPTAPTFGHTNKVAQLTGYDLASPSRRRRRLRSSLDSASSADSNYSDPETYHAHSPSREPSRDESEASLGSLSDSYSKWDSWAPVRETISHRQKATNEGTDAEGIFLPAGTYSNTSSALRGIHNKADAPPPRRPYRHQDERIRDSAPAEIHWRPTGLETSNKALTLDELIAQERARFEHDSFGRAIWHEHQGSASILSTSSRKPDSQNADSVSSQSRSPTWPARDADFHVQELALRPRHRPMSRFSDHSSSPDSRSTAGTTGFMSSVRDSVVSHVQNMSRGAPFGKASRPSSGTRPGLLRMSGESDMVVRDRSPATSAKRKRGVSGLVIGNEMAGSIGAGRVASGLRSPFSMRSPLSKKAHVLPTMATATATQRTLERHSRTSFAQRVGDALMHVGAVSVPGSVAVTGGSSYRAVSGRDAEGERGFSVSDGKHACGRRGDAPRIVQRDSSSLTESTIIIADHNRSAEGPDTPRPWMGREDGRAGGGWMVEILAGGMLERARRRTGIRSREERRRDRLKGRIRVVGAADQSPNGGGQ